MAKLVTGIPQNITEYPNSFQRQSASPLEVYSVFKNITDAQEYASSNPVSYVTQPIGVIENGEACYYIIGNEEGDLIRLGTLAQIREIYNKSGSEETGILINKIQETEKKIPKISGIQAVNVQNTTENGQAKTSVSLITSNKSNVKFTQDKDGLSANIDLNSYKTDVENEKKYKQTQAAVKEPTTSTGAKKIAFIDSISQDAQGVISATKREVDFSSCAVTVTPTDDDKSPHGLKCYSIKQNGVEVGHIDIPKDLVVTSGVVRKPSDVELKKYPTLKANNTYIILTIANQVDPLFIDTSTLVNIYQGKEGATQIQIKVEDYVISANIVGKSITKDEIADSAIITDKIENRAVTEDKIDDGAVTKEKIYAHAITGARIDDDTIDEDNSKIAAKTITAYNIDDYAVTNLQIGNNSIDYEKIQPWVITGRADNYKSHIALETITGGTDEIKGNIAPNTITAYNIADGAITEAKIDSKVRLVPITEDVGAFLRWRDGGPAWELLSNAEDHAF